MRELIQVIVPWVSEFRVWMRTKDLDPLTRIQRFKLWWAYRPFSFRVGAYD
jgi:hypothetical protein